MRFSLFVVKVEISDGSLFLKISHAVRCLLETFVVLPFPDIRRSFLSSFFHRYYSPLTSALLSFLEYISIALWPYQRKVRGRSAWLSIINLCALLPLFRRTFIMLGSSIPPLLVRN